MTDRAYEYGAYGLVLYGILWFVSVAVLFGYEEQWAGPGGPTYTLASMTAVEQVAFALLEVVLVIPGWPLQWMVGGGYTPIAPLVSGALVGAAVGWWADRRARVSG